MATRKMKKYAEGDIVEGENPNIDDETRARARKYVEDNVDMEGAPKFTPKAVSPAKSKMVTKEELEKSGLSLRDYMNKQQGLTRRGSSMEKAFPMNEEKTFPKTPDTVRDTGDESARLESRYKKPAPKYETPYDRMNRTNREAGIDFDSAIGKLKKRITGASEGGQDRILTGIKKKSDENKFMGSTGMKSGGKVSSASKRADGCAIRGKTRA
jgi:hypothetical protein